MLQVSRIQLVELPCASRLARDPQLVNLREGSDAARSLFAFRTILLELAATRAQPDAPPPNHEASVATRLLQDVLGGNAHGLLIGSLARGECEASAAVLKLLQGGMGVMTWPVVMDELTRGLLTCLAKRCVGGPLRARAGLYD